METRRNVEKHLEKRGGYAKEQKKSGRERRGEPKI